MDYVIYDGELYICKKGSRYQTTNKLSEAASWSDEKKARNILGTLPRTLIRFGRPFDVFVKESDGCFSIPCDKDVELEFDIEDKVSDLCNWISKLEERKRYLIYQLSNIDKEICDIMHASEFYVLNACEGYKMYKRLHVARVKRRNYKNEIEKIGYILSAKTTSGDLDKVKSSIESISERKYTPRILNDLFKT